VARYRAAVVADSAASFQPLKAVISTGRRSPRGSVWIVNALIGWMRVYHG
jgi:hypothetical protein